MTIIIETPEYEITAVEIEQDNDNSKVEYFVDFANGYTRVFATEETAIEFAKNANS